MDTQIKIAVTGANGFLASYVIDHLVQAGFNNIIGFYHSSPGKQNITWKYLDLQNPVSIEDAMEGIDCLIHLAGLVSYNKKEKENLFQINHLATRYLVNACLFQQVKSLLFCSSASTLSKSDSPFTISEEGKGDPVFYSNYAHSKYLAELEVFRAEAEGLHIAIIHPSLILGVGNWNKGSSVIYKQIYDGLAFFPTGSIGLVHANDVAAAIVLIILKQIWGERFLLVNESYSYEKLFTKLASGFNLNGPHRRMPESLAKSMIFFDKLRSLISRQEQIITQETVTQVYQNYSYDNSKSKNILHLVYKNIDEQIKNDCKSYFTKFIK